MTSIWRFTLVFSMLNFCTIKTIYGDKMTALDLKVDKEYNTSIHYDKNTSGEFPSFVIDGSEISWNELGRQLMTFEGFNLNLILHEEDFNRFAGTT